MLYKVRGLYRFMAEEKLPPKNAIHDESEQVQKQQTKSQGFSLAQRS